MTISPSNKTTRIATSLSPNKFYAENVGNGSKIFRTLTLWHFYLLRTYYWFVAYKCTCIFVLQLCML